MAAVAIHSSLAEAHLLAEPVAAPVPSKLVSAQTLAEQTAALTTKPGNFNFLENTSLPFACALTVEQGKSAREFEWHEGRDHILQILKGETVYEVGGTSRGIQKLCFISALVKLHGNLSYKSCRHR